MSDNLRLGRIIETLQHRDAIHIAVAPVKAAAGQYLAAGDHIGFVGGDTETVGRCGNPIGIVDPFLDTRVQPGESFWMFLYPQTITSLRHEWTHPAFEQTAVAAAKSTKDASEAWLRAFVAGADCPSYETVIATAIGEGSEQLDDSYLHFNGHDAHGDIPAEFWDHVERVTGRAIPMNKRAAHFSCSC